ncbi:polysaccharide synthesis protein GtrA [Pseudomonas sp. NPDC085632]|uniref:polysaccharide synthesis protein GtrA n=1 Tax=Pseudomonas sp. NPDC085632 TaxID=3364429 RepID=UPI0037C6DBEE
MKGFSALTVIRLADGLIHWQIFFVLCTAAGLTQAASNFAAFCVAAAFSFYVNVLYTFERNTSLLGYLLFIGGMGGVSVAIGSIADAQHWHGWVTVASFTLLNLLAGYLFFRFVLLREHQE